MLNKISTNIAVVCLLTFSLASFLYGQATGSISGNVTDTTGSAVPGAKVTSDGARDGSVAIFDNQ